MRQLFLKHETEAILDIPLSRLACPDSRYWKGSSNGIYSVKSGYLMEVNFEEPPPFQSSYHLQGWWTFLWGLHILPKVWIFLWRVASDYIPSDAILLKHHVPSSGFCPVCKVHIATISHCLFFCFYVRHVWKNTTFWRLLKPLSDASFLDCVIAISKFLTKDDFQLFTILTWAVWNIFCTISHSSCKKWKCISVDCAVSLLLMYQKVNSICVPPSLVAGSSDWV